MKDNRAIRSRAISVLEEMGLERAVAFNVTNVILDMLKQPDRYMLSAGMAKLTVPVTCGLTDPADRRKLARAIWRAMLEETW